jgi:pimeloyl-ACP methyl ester carboxylesterase
MIAMPDVQGVEHRWVDAGGVRLHVAEAGDGPPMLLLHGWPQHWWCWRELIGPLARDHRVIVPDLRGWGWSDAPAGAYGKATFARDVVALLDAEGIDRVQVVGHDWGGFTAFLLALEHPERVERAVCLDIVPPWASGPSLRHAALPLLSTYAVAVGTPVLGPRLMTAGGAFVRGVIRAGSAAREWSEEELETYARVLREPARARASSACYRTFITREVPALAARRHRPEDLAVDTLLVMGARSPLQLVLDPQPAGLMRVERVPGAGHFLPEEAPGEVLALVQGFLRPAPAGEGARMRG